MSNPINRREKWRFLTVGASWDRSTVPIYEAVAHGRCVPLLKTLLTNQCTNDCMYCEFRAGRDGIRDSWNPEELARVAMHLWDDGEIEGLFLSSSVFKDPDYVTERQISVLRILRSLGHTGYIHLRLMPGVSRHYIREAVELADRIGINLEAPNKEVFSDLCPSKGGFDESILKRLEWVIDEIKRADKERKEAKFGFGRSGVDTQMIVGAVEDNDLEYLKTSEWLYNSLGLRRVYFSGFEPIQQTPLENKCPCPPYREYRLYQSSFLIRDYCFKIEDLAQIVDDRGFLPNMDPKIVFSKKNPDMFPIDLNTATYYEIVRIPRIGPLTARKIIEVRKEMKIQYFSDLERIVGANIARAVSPYVDLKDKRLTYFSKEILNDSCKE